LSGRAIRTAVSELSGSAGTLRATSRTRGAERKDDEATAAIATIDKQREETIEQLRRERYGDLVEAERKADGVSEQEALRER
jgi:uncharacterized protein YqeY